MSWSLTLHKTECPPKERVSTELNHCICITYYICICRQFVRLLTDEHLNSLRWPVSLTPDCGHLMSMSAACHLLFPACIMNVLCVMSWFKWKSDDVLRQFSRTLPLCISSVTERRVVRFMSLPRQWKIRQVLKSYKDLNSVSFSSSSKKVLNQFCFLFGPPIIPKLIHCFFRPK